MPNLADVTWGFVTTQQEKYQQTSDFVELMQAIAKKPQHEIDDVCVALQLSLMACVGYFTPPQYRRAQKILLENPNLINQALHKIYFTFLTNDQKHAFITKLAGLKRHPLHAQFTLFIGQVKEKEKEKESKTELTRLFNAIRLNLKGALKIPYKLSSRGVLVVDGRYTFHLEYNDAPIMFEDNKKMGLISFDSTDSEQIIKYIVFKVLITKLEKEHAETYTDLMNLSFEEFCAPQKSEQNYNYQLIPDLILKYFAVINMIQNISIYIEENQLPDEHVVCQINSEYKALAFTFMDFINEDNKAEFVERVVPLLQQQAALIQNSCSQTTAKSIANGFHLAVTESSSASSANSSSQSNESSFPYNFTR
jgi:hypothetical protein